MFIFIKIGGALITDKNKPLAIKRRVITQIAKQISQIQNKYPDKRLIIGNGAGSFGHYMVHKVNYNEDPRDRQRISAVRESVSKLNIEVVKALKAAGLPAVSFAPAAMMKQTGGKVLLKTDTLNNLLKRKKIPVVYGDVIDAPKGSRIISTEEALDVVARNLAGLGKEIENLIFLTSVNGVLDENSKVVPAVKKGQEIEDLGRAWFDVTGGMMQKVDWGFRALDFTKRVYIISGLNKESLQKAVAGKRIGTRITAS